MNRAAEAARFASLAEVKRARGSTFRTDHRRFIRRAPEAGSIEWSGVGERLQNLKFLEAENNKILR